MTSPLALAQVTYEVPDLDLQERFLTDFGLVRAARTEDALYMRGAGAAHHIHVSRRADRQGFVGASFEMATRADLEILARFPEASPVRPASEPGGGEEVVMHTPDGVEIRAIFGRATQPPLPTRAPNGFNNSIEKGRVDASVRWQGHPNGWQPQTIGQDTWQRRLKPCEALRLGHFVLHVRNHDETVRWFQMRFGLLASDYFLPTGEVGPVVGTFLRFDHGATPVDHHVLLVLQSNWVGVHHCSFEVADLDAIMGAHEYLLARGWTLDCGIGRHMLGSQIFDYWKDPFGFRVEHYTDGDVATADYVPTRYNGTASQTTQWGMEPSLDFFQ
ncbi:MAG: VOC family protein [Zoogloeaceae bacterium]|jgi:catechol-2,3-dioxygenase|nr:VOC family protein [Zoogloeaceae bacterium]